MLNFREACFCSHKLFELGDKNNYFLLKNG